MIGINYTLHGEDGDLRYEQRLQQHVPRVGELVTFDSDHSYQVVDVLWHLDDEHEPRVTATAHELGWHEHIRDVNAAWGAAHEKR